jgi:hypothetical protein
MGGEGGRDAPLCVFRTVGMELVYPCCGHQGGGRVEMMGAKRTSTCIGKGVRGEGEGWLVVVHASHSPPCVVARRTCPLCIDNAVPAQIREPMPDVRPQTYLDGTAL